MRIVGGALIGVLLAAALGLWLVTSRVAVEQSEIVVIADVASERLIRSGSVLGFANSHETHSWFGIPYARPPVGELRWRAPQRPEPWTQTLDALAHGSPCVQLGSPIGGVPNMPPGTLAGSEDCLRLNVWAPRYAETEVPSGDKRLPVMVWIHGGGNTIGYAGPQYEASLLAFTHRLVVVSINYRLGPFGWFAHPALLGSVPPGEERSGNFGTLDIIAALDWVRKNIEYFGGDPNNVTIFGESAGGTNVVSMLISRRARGLFQRAIVQSGSTSSSSLAWAMSYLDDEPPGHAFSSREVLLRLLIREGSASDRESAKVFVEGLAASEIASYLRAKTPQEIMQAYLVDGAPQRVSLPVLIRDGRVLPVEPALKRLGEGRGRYEVPVMLGSNRDEIKLFFSQDPEFISRYLNIFVRVRDEYRYETLSRFHSDMWKVNGVDDPAMALRSAQSPGVYAYRFDWDEEPVVLGADISLILGASHGLEIPFVFGRFRFGEQRITDLIFNSENFPGRKYVSDAMMSYWAEFAYTGTPGRGRARSLPEWEPWPEGDEGRFIVFDTPSSGGIRMEAGRLTRADVISAVDAEASLPQSEKCKIFWNLFRFSETWSEDEWRDMGRGGCRDIDIAEMNVE